MGNYIVQTDLDVYLSDEDLVQLTDDDLDGNLDDGKIEEAITAAESEVDSFLANRYTVPITGTIPETVKEWAVQLTTLRLNQRRLPVPEDVWEMARVARAQLAMVATGKMSLDIGVDPPEEPSGREAEFVYNDRVFTRTKFEGF